MSNTAPLAKTYTPADVEPDILARWNDAKAFHAQPEDPGKAYCIVIPPPNVTAALHMGHALNNTIQDILIRWRRMCGDNAMWMPGTDHAGIATQTVVEKRVLEETGRKRTYFSREEFVAKIQRWKDEYEARITNQLRAMGCSCDWDRQAFTLDEPRAKAVREAFFRMFEQGLIYRGKRLVNWDPATQTALADDEVEMEDVDGFFWYMKYPVVEKKGEAWSDTGEYVTVATTRPETMLGDTAVAVNPNDAERAKFLGKHVRLPIVNRVIPIIGDDYVVIPNPDSDDAKAKYASGFLKVTPAHDPNDYDIGQRHNLPIINVMAPDGTISRDHGWPESEWRDAVAEDAVPLGMDRYEAREAIVEWFRRNDLLADVKPYRHAVGHSYRSHVAIEPYLSDQWYVKVTDDRLAGAALRAMVPEQRDPQASAAAQASRDRKGAGPATNSNQPNAESHQPSPKSKPLNPYAFLITFSTHASWLRGDERGSVHRDINLPGEPYIPASEDWEQVNADAAAGDAVSLDASQRPIVRDTILEVARHRGWKVLALNVRTQHVHAVVITDGDPERAMGDFKSYGTRRLKEAGQCQDDKLWARHGSTRYLKDNASIDAGVRYVLKQQGEDLGGVYDGAQPSHSTSSDTPDAAGPAPLRSRLAWEGQLRFHPPRYAKTFQTWHENLRDWCISRQLWWGHRIPVWELIPELPSFGQNFPDFSMNPATTEGFANELQRRLNQLAALYNSAEEFSVRFAWVNVEGRVYVCARSEIGTTIVTKLATLRTSSDPQGRSNIADIDFTNPHYAEPAHAVMEMLANENTFEQDPDVLDTWFSSALWPFSTLGWPDNTPELARWNPGNVLCTAREIITLWVSRMVMTNLLFLDQLPFTDVFIHAMIQDGEGRKMSKSLGNGVDPLDIISSHGADAMRYTLALMTTDTQDVRMPVKRDEATGKNTSDKFDVGRNFANKLWNAVRFALSNLEEGPTLKPNDDDPQLSMADRWILSRLATTVRDADRALAQYQFNTYAQGLYDFIWRDLCDWYIEAVKPTVKQNASQCRVLALCIDATLRLLHPVMPFVTEKLWERLNEVAPHREISGVSLTPSALLVHASWPKVSEGLIDKGIEADFALLQRIISAVREARATYKVSPKQRIEATAKASATLATKLVAFASLAETLCNLGPGEVGPKVERPSDAAVIFVDDIELYLHNLVDADAERTRLTKQLAEAQKSVKALEGRLANPKYVDKAPAHLVNETREHLAAAKREEEMLRTQLEALGNG